MTASSYGSSVLPFVVGLEDDLRLADAQLVAFAAHRLDEHRQVELAAARHAEHAGVGGVLDAQRDVALELALQALARGCAR